MGEPPEGRPTLLMYVSALARIAFTTLAYYSGALGMPEENHAAKGIAWARIGAYSWAAWHFRKYLTHGEDSWARSYLAWCCDELGMREAAVEHYRLAYARNKKADIALYLAHAELDFGNGQAARRFHADVSSRRSELDRETQTKLIDLETRLEAFGPTGSETMSADALGPEVALSNVAPATPAQGGASPASNITGQRIVAFVIDAVIIVVSAGMIGYTVQLAGIRAWGGGWLVTAVGLLLKDIFGASPGKFIVGLRVVGKDAKDTNFGRRLARNVPLALAPAVADIPVLNNAIVGLTATFIACVDGVFLLLQGDRIGDKIAGTSVVRWD